MPEPEPQATGLAESQGRRHPRNLLNDLTGRDWIKFTKSWFICDSRRYARNKSTELHPARYPEEMVSEFVTFFSKPGEWVLDPFCGSGATLVSCQETGRNGVGVELSPEYARVARQRLITLDLGCRCHVLEGDARGLGEPAAWRGLGEAMTHGVSGERELWEGSADALSGGLQTPFTPSTGLPQFDFIMTSPPYFNMLRKSRGGVESVSKKRARAGLDVHYGDDGRDLGNLGEYDDYIEAMGGIFDGMAALLKPRRYLVVVVQNVREPDGEVRPLAWDLQARISRSWSFQGERIWCQNSKPLGIWGYPSVFVPNYHHHYCLIFRHMK